MWVMKFKDSSAEYTLYIGNYLNENIVKERGLPTFNTAGSNRMRRIAEAIKKQRQNIAIISPAVSLRTSWTGKAWHPPFISRAGNVPVLFCGTFGIPFAGTLFEAIFVLYTLQRLASKHRIKGIIIYNFNPTLVILAVWIKFFLKIPLFHNVEDISSPKLVDWLPKTEARPLQQLIFAICMSIIIRLSEGVIIPTHNFIKIIPNTIPFIVIAGCISIPLKSLNAFSYKSEKYPLRLFFAGKIEFEHGINYLMETLSLIAEEHDLSKKFRIDICGTGSKAQWTINYINSKLNQIEVAYHGFVSNKDYRQLLHESEICIALQNPNGRYGASKTPSKVYEYLGSGKMVIATKVGDLSLLPSEIITLCDLNDRRSLYQQLVSIAKNPEISRIQGKAAAKYAQEHFAYEAVGKKLVQFISQRFNND